MAKEITLPEISEDTQEAKVVEIMVQEGDEVSKDDDIIAVESDKATVEVPCPEAGTVKEIMVSEGDTIAVGDVILKLEESEDEISESKGEQDEDETKTESESKSEMKEKKSEKDEKQAEEDEEDEQKEETKKSAESQKEKKEKQVSADKEIPAAPGAKRLAREHNIDLNKLKGSGPDGLITEDDVRQEAGIDSKEKAEPSPLPDFSKWGETERKPLSEIRKSIAEQTQNSWQTIPHVTQFDEADVSGIQDYMEDHSAKVEEAGGKLTVTSILTKLVANAFLQFPKFNASIDTENEEVVLKKYIHIGIAVDTEQGLLVPIVRDVDRKTITELSVEITELAEKARNQKLSAEEMKGGNFVISNLGGIGGTQFTPVIYHPHVAILGVSEIKTKPMFQNGSVEPTMIVPLSLSYDHRLIDGATGARFLRFICNAMEDPYKAMLGE